MVATVPEGKAAHDGPADACGNRKKGVLERWSVEVLQLPSPLLHFYGAVMNFCRARNSGYLGKKTSAMKTLFGVNSRVAIVSLYSIRSCGLRTMVPGLSPMA